MFSELYSKCPTGGPIQINYRSKWPENERFMTLEDWVLDRKDGGIDKSQGVVLAQRKAAPPSAAGGVRNAGSHQSRRS